MFRRWRQHKHSRTIAGLTLGATCIAIAKVMFGGSWWDIVSGVGIFIFSIGLQGVIDMSTVEDAKPEDPPLL